MDHFTNFTYFTLGGHTDLQKYRYVYFIMTLAVYIMIILFNSVVIFVIFTKKHFHEPMYIFIAALLCNALFGATAFYPKLLIDLLSEEQTSYYYACLFQAFFVYMYCTSEFTLLSAMAYDRYVSICKPLQYRELVKMQTVKKLLLGSWLLPCCELSVSFVLTSRLQFCKFRLNRIYCDNYSIVKLSCVDTSVNNLYGLFLFSIAVFPPVFFIIYSYIRILAICLKRSKGFRTKALQTCLPHLIIFINFTVNISFEIINNRIESNKIPHIIVMIMSIEYLLIPPLFNPIIYGLKLHDIFNSIKQLVLWKKTQVAF